MTTSTLLVLVAIAIAAAVGAWWFRRRKAASAPAAVVVRESLPAHLVETAPQGIGTDTEVADDTPSVAGATGSGSNSDSDSDSGPASVEEKDAGVPARASAGEPGDQDGPALLAESGPLDGSRFVLVAPLTTIGRDPKSCEIVYPAETVSRKHARIEARSDGSFVVSNLSTTNKTWVNDAPIDAATTVRAGDRIRVSKVVFRVV